MTPREVFDKVKAHLLAQGRRARNDFGCTYRGDDGARCAVGCLISDEAYSPKIEGLGARYIEEALVQSGIPTDENTIRLLTALQIVHDTREPGEWPAELARLEREHFPAVQP